MEFFDLYDRDRIKTGKTLARGGEPVPEGLYRMVVHICIFGSDGKMLIQQRQPFKDDWSGLWDISVGGCSVAGDTSLSAAIREVSEEIGVCLKENELRRVFTIQTEHVFDDIYVVSKNIDITALSLQPEEVARVTWADIDTVKDMLRREEVIPYH